MTEPFGKPAAPGGGVDLDPLLGALLIIDVQGIETGVNTVHGVSDAVRADVHVVDGPLAGEYNADVLLFPRVLQGQLKGRVGQKVLGRLGRGEAKPGKNAPWLLEEATPADTQLGVAYLARGLSKPDAGTPVGAGSTDTPPF